MCVWPPGSGSLGSGCGELGRPGLLLGGWGTHAGAGLGQGQEREPQGSLSQQGLGETVVEEGPHCGQLQEARPKGTWGLSVKVVSEVTVGGFLTGERPESHALKFRDSVILPFLGEPIFLVHVWVFVFFQK